MFKTGDILRIDLGKTIGHEQQEIRPCIVACDHPNLKLVTILPCTTSSTLHYYYIVKLKPNSVLPKDGCILCHQIRTISYDRVIERLGELEEQEYLKVLPVLSEMFGFL